jgi:hypothetical protein
MALQIPVSVGEFLDKITILEIKAERIHNAEKLQNVHKELDLLRSIWAASPLSETDVSAPLEQLKKVNESLWEIEDRIRRHESARTFDAEFIRLARSVYAHNDQRAAIKRDLNRRLGSDLVEEKSYPEYDGPSS